jgi:hypothetical protein
LDRCRRPLDGTPRARAAWVRANRTAHAKAVLEERDIRLGTWRRPRRSPSTASRAAARADGWARPGALAGAIEDALAQYGVRCDELPLTPRKVRELVRAGEKR